MFDQIVFYLSGHLDLESFLVLSAIKLIVVCVCPSNPLQRESCRPCSLRIPLSPGGVRPSSIRGLLLQRGTRGAPSGDSRRPVRAADPCRTFHGTRRREDIRRRPPPRGNGERDRPSPTLGGCRRSLLGERWERGRVRHGCGPMFVPHEGPRPATAGRWSVGSLCFPSPRAVPPLPAQDSRTARCCFQASPSFQKQPRAFQRRTSKPLAVRPPVHVWKGRGRATVRRARDGRFPGRLEAGEGGVGDC